MGQSKTRRIKALEEAVANLIDCSVPRGDYSRDQAAISDQITKLVRAGLVAEIERAVARVELAKALGLLQILGLAEFPAGIPEAVEVINSAQAKLGELVNTRLQTLAAASSKEIPS